MGTEGTMWLDGLEAAPVDALRSLDASELATAPGAEMVHG
jgi:hypothetical protein